MIGIFDNREEAQKAVQRLTAYGFTHDDIDMSSQGNTVMSDNDADMRRDTDHNDDGFGEKVSRFFSNLFDSDEDTEKYSSVARNRTIVSIHAETKEEAERAADILDEHGAINVDEHASGHDRSTSSMQTNAMDRQSTVNTDGDTGTSIPVIEEELHVGKREVQTGGMRVRSRIIERPVEESLRLREERVRVERTPVNRPASESDLSTFREGEIEVRERAEVPVVNKEARVVEEINVRKDVEEREERVRDTVRKTDVEVEPLENNSEMSAKKSKMNKNT